MLLSRLAQAGEQRGDDSEQAERRKDEEDEGEVDQEERNARSLRNHLAASVPGYVLNLPAEERPSMLVYLARDYAELTTEVRRELEAEVEVGGLDAQPALHRSRVGLVRDLNQMQRPRHRRATTAGLRLQTERQRSRARTDPRDQIRVSSALPDVAGAQQILIGGSFR